MFLATLKHQSAVLLAAALFVFAGCDLMNSLLGGGTPSFGPSGLTIGGTVQLHLDNQSGLPVTVDANYTIGTQQVRFTTRFLTADGKDTQADVLATVAEKLIITARVSVQNPQNSAAPGDILLQRELAWQVDFKDGERLVVVIPPPQGPATNIIDCNANGIADADDIAAGTARDCNCNLVPDSCDFAAGLLTDLNGDHIADQCYACPPLNVVFLFDTSGSMVDEAAAVCNSADDIIDLLQTQGIAVSATMLGIFGQQGTLRIDEEEELPPDEILFGTTTQPGDFACIENYVDVLFGTQVPGNPPAGCDELITNEDWGPAIAIVAQNFPWQAGAVRIIVPITDEGPCRGNPCSQFGSDGDSLTAAGNVAVANQVVVSPIVGNGASTCVTNLAQAVATQTGGQSFSSTDPQNDIVTALQALMTTVCGESNQCP